jgi:hypothetical protein
MEDFAAGYDQREKVMPARCGLYPFRRKIRPALWKKPVVERHLRN